MSNINPKKVFLKVVKPGIYTFCLCLSLLFAWAKLTGIIDWSWWIVLAPGLYPFYIFAAVVSLLIMVAIIGAAIVGGILGWAYLAEKWERRKLRKKHENARKNAAAFVKAVNTKLGK